MSPVAVCLSLIVSANAVVLATSTLAQQPQIPTLQVCNLTRIDADGEIEIIARADGSHSGHAVVHIGVSCDPEKGPFYPVNSGSFLKLDLNDSLTGEIRITSFDQVTTTGQATPTAYMNGRCEAQEIRGCRIWLMVADNRNDQRGTPDVVGFLVLDSAGKRMAYATGPLVAGNATVIANAY